MELNSLKKLFPYLSDRKYYVVGGFVIRYYLEKHKIESPFKKFNDLDVCIDDVAKLSPDIQNDFLVYHFHPQHGFISLVDAGEKIKIDCFVYNPKSESQVIQSGNVEMPIATIEDQLAHTVLDIQKIDGTHTVDPKEFESAEKLMKIANIIDAQKIWNEIRNGKYPESIEDAYKTAQKTSSEYPERLKTDSFRKNEPYRCKECDYNGKFKIEPMENIYKILGYVE